MPVAFPDDENSGQPEDEQNIGSPKILGHPVAQMLGQPDDTDMAVEDVDFVSVDDSFSLTWLRDSMRRRNEYDLIHDCIEEGELQEPVLTLVAPYLSYLMYEENSLTESDSDNWVYKARVNHAARALEVELQATA